MEVKDKSPCNLFWNAALYVRNFLEITPSDLLNVHHYENIKRFYICTSYPFWCNRNYSNYFFRTVLNGRLCILYIYVCDRCAFQNY